jgi:biotin operon repressor
MPTNHEEQIYSTQPLPEGTMFDNFGDGVLRRAADVVAGRNCPWPTKETQRRFLHHLMSHQGKGRAVPATYIAARMSLTQRAVKELVQDLRLSFGVQIGASRDAEGGGYYLVATEAESEESCSQMWNQAISMLRTTLVMRRGRQTLAELTRQIELELKEVA